MCEAYLGWTNKDCFFFNYPKNILWFLAAHMRLTLALNNNDKHTFYLFYWHAMQYFRNTNVSEIIYFSQLPRFKKNDLKLAQWVKIYVGWLVFS